jgi:thioredoxin 1
MSSLITVIAIILMFAGAANAELPSANAATVNQALLSGKPTLIDFGLRTCAVPDGAVP